MFKEAVQVGKVVQDAGQQSYCTESPSLLPLSTLTRWADGEEHTQILRTEEQLHFEIRG